jgi:hypothetical protein
MNEKIMHAILYGYAKSKVLASFMDVNAAVMDAALADEKLAADIVKRGAAGVQHAVAMMEKAWLAGRPVVNGMRDSEPILGEVAQKILANLQFTDSPHMLVLAFGWLPDGEYKLYRYNSRNVRETIDRVVGSPHTAFTLRNRFNAYGAEAYGIALAFDDYAIALEGVDAGTGTMGAYTLRVTEATSERIVADNGAKYLDITPFVRGLS